MDDDERFVARRGKQGEWHWQGQAPPEPEPDRPSLLARWMTSLSERLKASGRWLGARFSNLGAAAGRLGGSLRSPRPAPPDTAAETVHDELANGWAPVPTSTPEVPSGGPSAGSTPEEWAERPPRVAIRWSRFAPPRPKLNISRPEINFQAPELATTRLRATTISDDLVAPLAVVAGLVLASIIAVVAIVAVQALDTGGDGGIVVAVTDTPKPSDTPTPSGSATPSPTKAPSTATPPGSTTPVPTATPVLTPVVPATKPQGAVSVAYWANKLNAWWFGNLTHSVANYEEGQDIPFIVRWDGVAGQTYWLRIVSDCRTPDTFGTIDYLSGVQDWGAGLKTATYGPGSGRPDGAIPVPDTPNFDPDKGNAAIFTLYGAKFPVLPLPPHPDGNCDYTRTQDLPIQAYGGPIIFLASAHLGTATVYSSGEGASTASVPFGLHISVDGVGGADVMVDPSAIADVER